MKEAPRKTRILYMEDDAGLARLLGSRLEREGYLVELARNGSEGLVKLGAEHYDLAIVDYHMPEATGLDVIRVLSEGKSSPPVIMLTGAGDERVAVEAMKLGAADYLIKDIDMSYFEILPIVIGRILDRVKLDAERQQLEEELLRARRLEAVGTLAGGIAHDFNNLLAAILGNISFARLLAGSDERIQKLLGEGEKAAVRAGELVNQLITFSRGGAPVRTEVQLADILRTTSRFALTGTVVQCRFDIPGDLRTVWADEGQIRQVVHTIVQNGAEAMGGKGTLWITARNVELKGDEGLPLKSGAFVKVSFRDEGGGISPENLPKIFDPYFSTKERGSRKGMGLGLAIGHSIMKAHEGLILAESEIGAGTTIHVYFPVCAAGSPGKNREPAAVTTGSGRILIMDDEEAVREIAGSMLAHLGYEPTLAENGEDAVRLVREARERGAGFDAVILDLTIPGGMGGKDALRTIREVDPDVRAIVSSGYSDDPIMSSFREHGFAAVIAKPYRLSELSDVVAQAVARRT